MLPFPIDSNCLLCIEWRIDWSTQTRIKRNTKCEELNYFGFCFFTVINYNKPSAILNSFLIVNLNASFSVSKFIRIGIADKNDNPPYFDKSLYEAEVDENEDIQHTVLTVTANDKDECK